MYAPRCLFPVINPLTSVSVKSFLTYEDASAFAAGREPASAVDDTKPPRFYGVAVGRKPGVYTEWPAAQEAIIGWKGPKYKKFETRAEAEAFVRSFSGSAKAIAPTVAGSDQDDADGIEEPTAKRRKTTKKTIKAQNGLVIVYTDGSSLGNGRVGATAGVGVYFGANDPRYVYQHAPYQLELESMLIPFR